MKEQVYQQVAGPAQRHEDIIMIPEREENQEQEWGKPQKIISGFRWFVLEQFLRLTIVKLVFRNFSNPIKVFHILKTLDKKRRLFLGESRLKKAVQIDGRIFWDIYSPGWKSPAFEGFIEGEINRISKLRRPANRLNNVVISITNKCSYKCEHCFEWDFLNKKENLNLEEMISIVKKFQAKGIGQILFSGGEPMLKVNEMVTIMRSAGPQSDFWVYTSGFNLTRHNAQRLKEAGLTGVFISLDHFDPVHHDAFRGVGHAFEKARQAIIHSKAENLVVGISICLTKVFTNENNLKAYLDLAKEAGVSFVQLLEPKDVGHYAGKDVALTPIQEKMLDDFFQKMNYSPKYLRYPIISYMGVFQRKIGCLGSGNRNLYIDADGDLHGCPFCRSKTGNALQGDLDENLEKLQLEGCHRYRNSNE